MIVTFLPQNIKQPAQEGERLLEVAAKANITLDGNCGKGRCGKCKLQVISGKVTPLNAAEIAVLTKTEINNGYRLACCIKVEDDLSIIIPNMSSATLRKSQLAFMPKDFNHKNYIIKRFVDIEPSTLRNQKGDVERIISSLKSDEYRINPTLLPSIPEILKQSNFKVTVVEREKEIIALEVGDTISRCYGVAFDIGTTTVVGMLWNLNKGELIGVSAMTNPQSTFGADVISRIDFSSENRTNLDIMKDKIRECINEIIQGFENEYSIKFNEIYEACVVGNTAMSHLFLGVNPKQLAKAPFAPVFCIPVDILAKDINININKLANIHVLPNIAGHAGSDIGSGILATRIIEKEGLQLFIDVGTNGDIVLSQNGRVLTCSTAAGPAFEGSTIYQGMRATTGAIEGVKIENGEIFLKTIDNQEPMGICGAGVIDAVSQMLNEGIIDCMGNLLDRSEALDKDIHSEIAWRLRNGIDGREFVLVRRENAEDIVLTQRDIREVQLAKAAIYSGTIILLTEIGAVAEDIEKITIASAFGNYISKESALEVGLFPRISIDKIVSVGNAAGIGASMALLSMEERRKAQIQAQEIEHIELATYVNFQTEYLKAMKFI